MPELEKKSEKLRMLCDDAIALLHACDYESVAELYTEETQFLAPGFSRITTKESVKKFWKNTFKAGYRFQSIDTVEIRVIGDMAYWLFNWVLTHPDGEGNTVTQTGKNVIIWENTDLGWLARLDSWNSPS